MKVCLGAYCREMAFSKNVMFTCNLPHRALWDLERYMLLLFVKIFVTCYYYLEGYMVYNDFAERVATESSNSETQSLYA